MPHFVVEYTNNIKDEANIPLLLEKVNKILIAKSPIFPTGGIRSRAIELNDYYIADGEEDDAFVHATLKIGAGRPDDIKKATCDEVFATIKDHFSSLYNKRYLALSMELFEFSEAGTYKQNNIHSRFKK
ncbi:MULTISPECIES: 5-carboxymethyl-2-hydroxymuconate Delta-isomerase [Metabacillus]|jgi:5-carboxymethyl-2-hydroxymuconate isomerase|uniref:5-carboxymethyl-2-hydroxymuconate Delta-isomerase n=1 Tax=Metabacillus rhizolycopersici TaxID=2875709 RepID=A0ABS7UY23_9BACI|nr:MULTISPECIES: 5-carboxymethyl-2-hydroxymuconate Delta-isomerase [Metabacillus]MBZ5752898.1 5-carboxymethyl-2-hydroxymuconate Delta-isomerase [Metabacillus rhizolycopersici]MCM3651689.1 5-carboxymethyl-2-hydroxymuconate Delta-isomerase [Metabacillus litoralis]